MSDEATRGFTGTMIGITCVDSYRRDLFAHFDFFDIQHGAPLMFRTPDRVLFGAAYYHEYQHIPRLGAGPAT